MGKSIKEVMTPSPTTVEPGASVVEAARTMRERDTGIVPVVENGKLIGTVTDRDIVVRLIAEGRDPGSATVREIASTDLVTVDPQQELDEGLRLMAQHKVRRLPVVEEDGRLVGIVSQADVARQEDDARTGEVVEQISEPS
jgi:CBS domain-containing protein